MSKRAFWPGFSWRILAHERERKGQKAAHTGKSIDLDSGMGRQRNGYPGIRAQIAGDWEFDELVIDHWFHLEQMGDRHWWLGLGSYDEGSDFWHINISIDGQKRVTVSMEQENPAADTTEAG